MAMKGGISSKALSRLVAAKSAVGRAAGKAKSLGLVGRVATMAVTTGGGVIGGIANGLMEGEKKLGLRGSTLTGAGLGAVSLFLKGSAGDHCAQLAGGAFALSAGLATQQAIRKGKLNKALDGLLTPGKDGKDGKTPAENTSVQSVANRAAPTRAIAAGNVPEAVAGAEGTMLSAEELNAYVNGGKRAA